MGSVVWSWGYFGEGREEGGEVWSAATLGRGGRGGVGGVVLNWIELVWLLGNSLGM